MQIIYLIIFFILGCHMGSFYTVIGMRLPKHEDFFFSRSHCDKCNHPLSMLDMIPVLSYLLLKGRCRYCHKKISNISTYMEIFTGVLYALSFWIFGFSYELLVALGLVTLLSIISVSDIMYYIIPDELLIFFTGYFLIANALNKGVEQALMSVMSGVILFAIMYLIMTLGNFIFKKETLGGGDIKLMLVIGIVLNPFLGIISIFLSSFIALPISLLILLKEKKNIIPFGPFLIISAILIYMTKVDMTTIINWLKII